MIKITPPKHIISVLDTLVSKDFDAYIVGGSLRDAIMNRHANDWDVATSALPGDVAELFERTVKTGEKYGTVTVLLPECKVEVTTFRTDGLYLDNRHPETVEFISDIKEDLSRRDFTINAMAASISGEIIDPFDGAKDIKDGVIRCVGEPQKRFEEDALRMLRAFRFAAQLGFRIDKTTLSAIKESAKKAANVSAERIYVEIDKTLMSQKPEVAGEIIKAGLLDRFICGSYKNAIELSRLSKVPDEHELRWGVLCAVLLEEKCIESAATFLRELRLESKIISTIHTALTIREFPTDRNGQKRLLAKHGASAVRLAAVLNDVHTGQSLPSLIAIYNLLASGECMSLEKLALTGKDLMEIGITEGPELGEKLQKLLDYVIINPSDNKRDILLNIVKNNTL